MNEQRKHLQDLRDELHEVNQDFARAALPLERLPELSLEQRQQVADRLRAANARWESVSEHISQLLGTGSTHNEGGLR